ncbi:MAG: hypothetical protein GXO82_01535 [Chlorobi bacterium]|nr:hypothetical protein [Chlorobiota bacterium]
MRKFLSQRNKIPATCAIILLSLAGCLSVREAPSVISYSVEEVNVWCDFMPGVKPSLHAQMLVNITNMSPDSIRLFEFTGSIFDITGYPLRRFTVHAYYEGNRVREISLPPADSLQLDLRSIRDVPPIDVERFHTVSYSVVCRTSLNGIVILRADSIQVFTTQ